MSELPSEADCSPALSLRFEEALAQLEAVLHRLEQGQDHLEDALRDYERGLALLRHCRQLLQQAEAKVQQLVGVDEHGEPRLEPFDHTSRLAQTRQQWGTAEPQQESPSEQE